MERGQPRKSKVEDTGVLQCNVIFTGDEHEEWIEAKEFSLTGLASEIGVDLGHKVKVKVTLEVVQEPCLYCGRVTSGDKLCDRCHVVVCDECAKANTISRYCPPCQQKETGK